MDILEFEIGQKMINSATSKSVFWLYLSQTVCLITVEVLPIYLEVYPKNNKKGIISIEVMPTIRIFQA